MSENGAFVQSENGAFIESENNARGGGGVPSPILLRSVEYSNPKNFSSSRIGTLSPDGDILTAIAFGPGDPVVPVGLPALASQINATFEQKQVSGGIGTVTLTDLSRSVQGAVSGAVRSCVAPTTLFPENLNRAVLLRVGASDVTLQGADFTASYGTSFFFTSAQSVFTNSEQYGVSVNDLTPAWPESESLALANVVKGTTQNVAFMNSDRVFDLPIPATDLNGGYFDGNGERQIDQYGTAQTQYQGKSLKIVNGIDHGDGTISGTLLWHVENLLHNTRVRWPDFTTHDLRETINPGDPSVVTASSAQIRFDEVAGLYATFQIPKSISVNGPYALDVNPVFPNVTITQTDSTHSTAGGDVANYLDFDGSAFQLGDALPKSVQQVFSHNLWGYQTYAVNFPDHGYIDRDFGSEIGVGNPIVQEIGSIVEGGWQAIATCTSVDFFNTQIHSVPGFPGEDTFVEVNDLTLNTVYAGSPMPKINPSNQNRPNYFQTSEGTFWDYPQDDEVYFDAALLASGGTGITHPVPPIDVVHIPLAGYVTSTNGIENWATNTNDTSGSGIGSTYDYTNTVMEPFPLEWTPIARSQDPLEPTEDIARMNPPYYSIPDILVSGQTFGASIYWKGASGGQDGICLATCTGEYQARYNAYVEDPTQANRDLMELEYTILLNNFASRRLIEAMLMYQGQMYLV